MKPLLTEPEPVPHGTLNTSLPLPMRLSPSFPLGCSQEMKTAIKSRSKPECNGTLLHACYGSMMKPETGPSHVPEQVLDLVLPLLVVETPEALNCNVTDPLYEAAVAHPALLTNTVMSL